MNKKNLIYLAIIASVTFSSCKRDPEPYSNFSSDGWIYTGGDAQVDLGQDIEIQFDIENNLNVDGNVEITSGISIDNDLNLNDDGRVVINPVNENDTIRISGNMNINDSLIILGGCILLEGDFNINATGIVSVSDRAKVSVSDDLNSSGQLHGNRNVTVLGESHFNGGSTTEEAPLFNN